MTERIAQQTVTLETFGPQHGLKMLAAHMEPSFAKHRLPTSIYPFTEDDVTALCSKATSPRSFIQAARTMFEAWLDEDVAGGDPAEARRPGGRHPRGRGLAHPLDDGRIREGALGVLRRPRSRSSRTSSGG